jgi:hypothetical protein
VECVLEAIMMPTGASFSNTGSSSPGRKKPPIRMRWVSNADYFAVLVDQHRRVEEPFDIWIALDSPTIMSRACAELRRHARSASARSPGRTGWVDHERS